MHKEKTVISYVKGALAEKSGDRIVVEAGPVGLGIYVPLSVLDASSKPQLNLSSTAL